jgi:hypothetical protein
VRIAVKARYFRSVDIKFLPCQKMTSTTPAACLIGQRIYAAVTDVS